MESINIQHYSGINPDAFPFIGSKRKRRYFLLDLHFREAFEDLGERLNKSEMTFLLKNYAPAIFKPESIAGRKIHQFFDLVGEAGFAPVTGMPVSYNRNTVRIIWQYQFNAAARGRIDLVDMMMRSGNSVYIIFRYHGSFKNYSNAIEALESLKGGSKLEEQHPGTLRYRLGWINEIMNYVHMPDDPADFIRELGILFAYEERQALLDKLFNNPSTPSTQEELSGIIQKAYSTQAEHDLSFVNSIKRITQYCTMQLNAPTDNALKKKLNSILEDCHNLTKDKRIDWRNFYRQCKTIEEINIWDVYTIVTTNAHLPPVKNVASFF